MLELPEPSGNRAHRVTSDKVDVANAIERRGAGGSCARPRPRRGTGYLTLRARAQQARPGRHACGTAVRVEPRTTTNHNHRLGRRQHRPRDRGCRRPRPPRSRAARSPCRRRGAVLNPSTSTSDPTRRDVGSALNAEPTEPWNRRHRRIRHHGAPAIRTPRPSWWPSWRLLGRRQGDDGHQRGQHVDRRDGEGPMISATSATSATHRSGTSLLRRRTDVMV